MIADLGGLIKGIIMIAMVMNYYVRDKLYYKKLVNKNIHSYSISTGMNKTSVSLMTLINNYKEKDNFDLLNMNNKSEIRNISETPHSLSDNRDAKDKDKDPKSIQVIALRGPALKVNNSNTITNSSNSGFRKLVDNTPATSKTLEKDKVVKKVVTQEALTTNNAPAYGNFKYTQKILLTNLEVVLPNFCFKAVSQQKMNLSRLEQLRKLVENQLDVNYIINKLNMVDKLTYIIAGEKYKRLLNITMNPYVKISDPNKFDSPMNYNQDDLSQLPAFMAQNIKTLTESR
jgi:hypothetical protein